MPLIIPSLYMPPKPAIIRPAEGDVRKAAMPGLFNPMFMSSGPKDPYFSNVVALLHMNGPNGSTTFTDNSPSPKTFTAGGNAQISTAQSVFGGSSGAFDGSGDYVQAASHADFAWPGDFTIEFRVRLATAPSNNLTLCNGVNSGSFSIWAANSSSWQIARLSQGGDLSFTWAPSLNTWYAFAVSRTSNTMRIFVDGIQIASGTVSTSYPQNPHRIGGGHEGVFVNGYFGAYRITKGFGRYTGNYSVAATPFPNG